MRAKTRARARRWWDGIAADATSAPVGCEKLSPGRRAVSIRAMSIVVGPPGRSSPSRASWRPAGLISQSRRLAEALTADGYEVVRTHDPTDGPVAHRASARRGDGAPVAARGSSKVSRNREHVRDLSPSLAVAGATVLVDRYYFVDGLPGRARVRPCRHPRGEQARRPRPDLAGDPSRSSPPRAWRGSTRAATSSTRGRPPGARTRPSTRSPPTRAAAPRRDAARGGAHEGDPRDAARRFRTKAW